MPVRQVVAGRASKRTRKVEPRDEEPTEVSDRRQMFLWPILQPQLGRDRGRSGCPGRPISRPVASPARPAQRPIACRAQAQRPAGAGLARVSSRLMIPMGMADLLSITPRTAYAQWLAPLGQGPQSERSVCVLLLPPCQRRGQPARSASSAPLRQRRDSADIATFFELAPFGLSLSPRTKVRMDVLPFARYGGACGSPDLPRGRGDRHLLKTRARFRSRGV